MSKQAAFSIATDANAGEDSMPMDFETVRFLRVVFAFVFACVGAAGGFKYYGLLGAVGGAFIGYIIGWNLVDLVKGRAGK
jgi:uncharacterized membrane protein